MQTQENIKQVYRFGFGGQEKDDEITGNSGTHYTAAFWEYDTRIGRRWNVDPVIKHHESPYATFANNPIWFTDVMGADSSLYNSENGEFMDRGITPEDDKTAIWTVDPTAEDYDKDNPWANATEVTYTIPSKKDKDGNRTVTGRLLRNNHPLAGKGWKFGDQVYEEDLLDMTAEFDNLVDSYTPYFAKVGRRWIVINSVNQLPFFRTAGVAGQHGRFVSLVGPNRKFDLKSQARNNIGAIPSYAAVVIGEYSFYKGRLMNYDDYGNYSFGAWGRAYGFGLTKLKVCASFDQLIHTGQGDPQRDQTMIESGYKH
ncbi:MAG: polymorphic toxin type 44 domain-containing protein [Bacteroidales bacterium]|jgi:hypothetical protein|nr:polymorphic toxin type 44 domain-containing protein [Bacteroidales bacterium]